MKSNMGLSVLENIKGIRVEHENELQKQIKNADRKSWFLHSQQECRSFITVV